MRNSSRKGLLVILVLSLLVLSPVVAQAGDSPIKGGGPLGIGLIVGGPGDWGAVGKIWIDNKNAFQPAVKLGNGIAILQLDYLWHTYDVIPIKTGLMPLYFGVGGDLALQNSVVVGARGVVGMSYLFNRTDVPVDIFLQVVPELWFSTGGGSSFNVYGELGGRYYF